ncbi:diaminopimelate dehydrogenase [Pontibaca methylaminivorans]|uniref:Meso-diaminopimelate D-dehydrogenase n=1 Tax=Pontibaca methylaminivorans TaxID=515897 RepID=A0A1R3X1U9_9RHOB|nr:diaminopimelate dehydrogenase [Pontibaca methylaminivorans]SIT83854.1 diaminopimelate dehydrogenase [Pontibaca methylaminivorans]
MNGKIRIAIAGHGNLGRGVEAAIEHNPDMSLAGIYSRRPAGQITPRQTETPVHGMEQLRSHADQIDVLILCGGSKEDLPQQGPELAALFNTVDSFDTHARIPEYFAAVDPAARDSQHTALISAGWDPGVFSLNRALGEALLPDGATYTFWGDGLSQGHSDALRRVPGVAGAVQYTRPAKDAINQVRKGGRPDLTPQQMHLRECFVVLEDGADAETVREAIVTMPHYFADYETVVNFISAEELARDHRAMVHGGFVIRSGTTSPGTTQVMEYSLKLGSNPEFTASVLVACARAVHRMHGLRQFGAKTIYDIPLGLLSPRSAEDLRAGFL